MIKQTNSFFGGLSETHAAMKVGHVISELYDEAIGSALTGHEFYQNLINKIPQGNTELAGLLTGISLSENHDVFQAYQAQRRVVEEANVGNDQVRRTQLAKLQKGMIALSEKVEKAVDQNYKTMPTLLQESLKRVTDKVGNPLTLENNTDHRSGLASIAQSDIYYIDLQDEKLIEALQERGISLVVEPGDDIQETKKCRLIELLRNGWGHHGRILVAMIQAIEGKISKPPSEFNFAKAGRKQIDEFKVTDEGLKATLERTATRLLNMLVDNANYEKANQPTYGEGMFSRKKSFKALDYINQQRGQQVSDVEILNHILAEGSTRPGGKYRRSLGLLEAAVPQYTKAETGQTGKQFLQAVMGSHPACQPNLSQPQRRQLMTS